MSTPDASAFKDRTGIGSFVPQYIDTLQCKLLFMLDEKVASVSVPIRSDVWCRSQPSILPYSYEHKCARCVPAGVHGLTAVPELLLHQAAGDSKKTSLPVYVSSRSTIRGSRMVRGRVSHSQPSPVLARVRRSSRRRKRGFFLLVSAVGSAFLIGLWLGLKLVSQSQRAAASTSITQRKESLRQVSIPSIGRASDASLCGVLPAPCSGHGECRIQQGLPTLYPAPEGNVALPSELPPNSVAFCACDAGWAPPACDRPLCPGGGHCSGNGVCLQGTCVCEGAWGGEACSELQPGTATTTTTTTAAPCPRDADTGLVCGGPQRGACVSNGTCVCHAPWTGTLCENQAFRTVYEFARRGAGTLQPCQVSPSPQATPFIVAALPPAEAGRRWLGFQALLIPTNHEPYFGTKLPWLCIAYDLAERLSSNSIVSAFDIVVTRWIEMLISGERAWQLTAAMYVPANWTLDTFLPRYVMQILPIKIGVPVRVEDVRIDGEVSLIIANDSERASLFSAQVTRTTTATRNASSVSVVEAIGIAAMGALTFVAVLAAVFGIDAWLQRRRRSLQHQQRYADGDTSANSSAATSPPLPLGTADAAAMPSAPPADRAPDSTPLGMNLEELVTISLSPERPWKYRSWRHR